MTRWSFRKRKRGKFNRRVGRRFRGGEWRVAKRVQRRTEGVESQLSRSTWADKGERENVPSLLSNPVDPFADIGLVVGNVWL